MGNVDRYCFWSFILSYINIYEIFIIAGGIGALILVYSILFIPPIEKANQEPQSSNLQMHPLKKALRTLTDGEFFKSCFFVGIIGRAVITGIILFAMPLLLKDKFNQPEIGQILIVYFAGFFLSSLLVSKTIKKNKHLRLFLFLSTQLAGLALFSLGFMNWEYLARILPNTLATTIFITSSLALLGLSHGLLSIPISRHILQTKSSTLWSKSSLKAAYLFLESIGAVAGPLLIAQLLILLHAQTLSISWIGVLSILGGILFISGKFTPPESEPQEQEEIIPQLEDELKESFEDKIEDNLEDSVEDKLGEDLDLNGEYGLEDDLGENQEDIFEDNLDGNIDNNADDLKEDDKDLL